MSAPGAQQQLGLAVDAVDALQAALVCARLYGHRHPETGRASERALQSLSSVLQGVGSVRIDATVDGLRWKGQVLSQEDDDREGLGRLLHKEGIASLTFYPELEARELLELLDVLRINYELPRFEEHTLEEQLWQRRLERVHYKAVSALTEAELVSGSARATLDGSAAGDAMDNLMRGVGQLSEDHLVRAIAGSDLRDLGAAEAADIAVEQADEDERPWEVQLGESNAQDAQAVAAMRAAVEGEGDGSLLARLIVSMLRVSLADWPDLPPSQALGIAQAALKDLYLRGGPADLMVVVDEAGALAIRHRDRHDLAAFHKSVLSAQGVTSLLVRLDDFSAASFEGTRKLIDRLGDGPLQELLMALARELPDPSDARAQALFRLLGVASLDRLHRWLPDAARMPPERLMPTVRLLHAADSEPARRARPQLLKHPAIGVRETVLHWYATDFPESDALAVAGQLLDRRPQVRLAASAALIAHPPSAAESWFRRTLASAGWSKLDEPVRIDVCVTFARAFRGRAVTPLAELLEAGSVLGVSHADAAAKGLAAARTEPARMALVKGAKSWVPARKKACLAALQEPAR